MPLLQNLKTKPKWIWPVAALVMLVVIATAGALLFKKNDGAEDTVQLVPVTRGDIQKVVVATGRVVPDFEVEIKGKGSGKIIRLPYDVGDTVKEGDLLVQLDPVDEGREVRQASASLSGMQNRLSQSQLNLQVARRSLETDLERARADLHAAEASARDAESKKKRLETLVQKRYISQEEYETGVNTAEQSDASLENARIRLQELETQKLALQAQARDVGISSADVQAQQVNLATAQQRLSETKIYAPISGVITSRAGQIGQIVASGISNVGGGTSILTLADLSHIYVLASVDESDIGQIREGQRVNVTADAYPGERFQGTVVRISPKGVAESNVVTFEVKIEVGGQGRALLKPEMTANVEILIAEKDTVLLVPVEAITLRGGKSFVKVAGKNNSEKLLPVTTGINNGVDVEITGGLSGNEKIMLGQRETQSRWRRDGQSGGNASMTSRRGQRMMMRGLGGGRR